MWLFWDIAIMQDYTEEFREITKGSKSKEALPAGSITLINQRPVGEDLHVKFCLHVTHTSRLNRFQHNTRIQDRLLYLCQRAGPELIGSLDRMR